MIGFFIFILGSIIGSFLNVCIYRLPLSQDVILKSSACPHCNQHISWKHNIPILSFLLLKGRCNNCKTPIHPHYLIVEVITALSFLIFYLILGLNVKLLLVLILTTALILIFFTDFKDFLIFDVVTLPMAGMGLVISFLNINPFQTKVIESLVGGLIGYGFIYLIRWLYLKIRKVEGMGLGDAKLFLMIGAWLGAKSLLFILLFSSVSGSVFGFIMILTKKNNKYSQIPYGCFIVLATFGYIFVGEKFYNFLQ